MCVCVHVYVVCSEYLFSLAVIHILDLDRRKIILTYLNCEYALLNIFVSISKFLQPEKKLLMKKMF